MTVKTDRALALSLLCKVWINHTPLAQVFHTHSLCVPAFTKAICFGVCRHYYRLELIANELIAKRPKSHVVWLTLLIGLYQLCYVNKPGYATINETVTLLTAFRCTWAKGFINATMRYYVDHKTKIMIKLKKNIVFNYGHPEWLLQLLQYDWPQHWQSMVHANDLHPPMSLRVNLHKISRCNYLHKLQTIGLDATKHHASLSGLNLSHPCMVDILPGFLDGEVSVQDESAQLIIELLQLTKGLRVLDACAAPGGKTAHILESEPNLQACIALDIDERRLGYINANLTRLNLQAAIIHGDAAHPEIWWDKIPFDRIILDAPCSATGVIRRHPDIKLLRTQADIERVITIQHNLLHSLWPLLAIGGIMVYATCSVLNCENENQIAKFISKTPNCSFKYHNYAWGYFTGHGWQILPGVENRDGFFYSVLQKNTEVYTNA